MKVLARVINEKRLYFVAPAIGEQPVEYNAMVISHAATKLAAPMSGSEVARIMSYECFGHMMPAYTNLRDDYIQH